MGVSWRRLSFHTTRDPAASWRLLGESFSGCLLTHVFEGACCCSTRSTRLAPLVRSCDAWNRVIEIVGWVSTFFAKGKFLASSVFRVRVFVVHAKPARRKQLVPIAIALECSGFLTKPVDDVTIVHPVLPSPSQPGYLLHLLLAAPDFHPVMYSRASKTPPISRLVTE
jgi:hypothetical protein